MKDNNLSTNEEFNEDGIMNKNGRLYKGLQTGEADSINSIGNSATQISSILSLSSTSSTSNTTTTVILLRTILFIFIISFVVYPAIVMQLLLFVVSLPLVVNICHYSHRSTSILSS